MRVADPDFCARQRTGLLHRTVFSYRKYVQNARGRGFDADGAWALEACSKGNTEAAIPVLEKKLRDSGFSLPKEFKP